MSTGGGASLEFLEGAGPARRGGAERQVVEPEKARPETIPTAARFISINCIESMNKERKLIIAGNWKMNKTVAEALDLVRGLKIELANVKEVDIVVCPPFTALGEVSKAILDSNIRLGAQNMSEHNVGALHRRNRRRDAQGILRALRHPRPLRAAAVPEGIGRADRQEGAGGPCRLAQADCLRRRNAGRTRSGPDGEGSGDPGARQPGRVEQGADGRNGRRLRTGLGHRHRQDGHDRSRRRRPMPSSAGCW